MAVHQLRFSCDGGLKGWLRQSAVRLESEIPVHCWIAPAPPKEDRVSRVAEAMRTGLLAHIRAFDLCGFQTTCDESCQPAPENRSANRFWESQGEAPVERYLLRGARDAEDLARKLLAHHLLKWLPLTPFDPEGLLLDLRELITPHLYINDLCGMTSLCRQAAPKDLKSELAR